MFFDLDFTLAVFDPETNIGNDFKYRGREKLVEALGLTELTDIRYRPDPHQQLEVT